MSRDEGGFRMVPVAVGVDFGTTNSVVAIADRSGQVKVRRFDTQVGAVEAYRSALLFFREGRPPNATPTEGWKTISSWYVVRDADNVSPPPLQMMMAQRAKAHKLISSEST